MMRLIIDPGPPPTPPGICVISRSWPSRVDCKPEVIEVFGGELMRRGWVSEDERVWVDLCLDEVVVNAMMHGNEGDPTLPIELALFADSERWVLTVRDQGQGFTAAQVPDHEMPDSLLLEHGRGIRIMQEWLEELRYYEGGACAWLARRRADRTTACEQQGSPHGL